MKGHEMVEEDWKGGSDEKEDTHVRLILMRERVKKGKVKNKSIPMHRRRCGATTSTCMQPHTCAPPWGNHVFLRTQSPYICVYYQSHSHLQSQWKRIRITIGTIIEEIESWLAEIHHLDVWNATESECYWWSRFLVCSQPRTWIYREAYFATCNEGGWPWQWRWLTLGR